MNYSRREGNRSVAGLLGRQWLITGDAIEADQEDVYRDLTKRLRENATDLDQAQKQLIYVIQDFVKQRETLFQAEERAFQRFVVGLEKGEQLLSTLENTRSERDVRRKDVEPQEVPVLRPRPQTGAQVSVRDGVYVVDAPGSDRIAAMVDMGDWDAKMQFHDHLRRRGVLTALEEAGIEIGDTVRLGAKEWEWE